MAFYLDENQIELQDDNLNFFGLSEPKTLKFLNFPDQPKPYLTYYGRVFDAHIYLSPKIKI